jgi:hypothetical protein
LDSHNRFETRTTFAFARLEWLAALGVSITLAVMHLSEIRWAVFVGFFVIIDIVGYIPGAIAFRRSRTKQIPRGYYVAYNIAHSLVTGALMVGLWAWLVRPEWALLAVPIHLMGDRALFGNSLKPFGISFEPVTHPAYATFERDFASSPAGGPGIEAPTTTAPTTTAPAAASAGDGPANQPPREAVPADVSPAGGASAERITGAVGS